MNPAQELCLWNEQELGSLGLFRCKKTIQYGSCPDSTLCQ